MWARSSESKILRAGRRLHYWLGGCKVGSWRGRHFPRTWPGTMAACTRAHTTVKHITPRRIKKGTKSGWAHSLLLLLRDLLSIEMTCGTGFSPDNILYLFISFSLCVLWSRLQRKRFFYYALLQRGFAELCLQPGFRMHQGEKIFAPGHKMLIKIWQPPA